jgi:hypothetical protein
LRFLVRTIADTKMDTKVPIQLVRVMTVDVDVMNGSPPKALPIHPQDGSIGRTPIVVARRRHRDPHSPLWNLTRLGSGSQQADDKHDTDGQ